MFNKILIESEPNLETKWDKLKGAKQLASDLVFLGCDEAEAAEAAIDEELPHALALPCAVQFIARLNSDTGNITPFVRVDDPSQLSRADIRRAVRAPGVQFMSPGDWDILAELDEEE